MLHGRGTLRSVSEQLAERSAHAIMLEHRVESLAQVVEGHAAEKLSLTLEVEMLRKANTDLRIALELDQQTANQQTLHQPLPVVLEHAWVNRLLSSRLLHREQARRGTDLDALRVQHAAEMAEALESMRGRWESEVEALNAEVQKV